MAQFIVGALLVAAIFALSLRRQGQRRLGLWLDQSEVDCRLRESGGQWRDGTAVISEGLVRFRPPAGSPFPVVVTRATPNGAGRDFWAGRTQILRLDTDRGLFELCLLAVVADEVTLRLNGGLAPGPEQRS